jgi:hypothetical protein
MSVQAKCDALRYALPYVRQATMQISHLNGCKVAFVDFGPTDPW